MAVDWMCFIRLFLVDGDGFTFSLDTGLSCWCVCHFSRYSARHRSRGSRFYFRDYAAAAVFSLYVGHRNGRVEGIGFCELELLVGSGDANNGYGIGS